MRRQTLAREWNPSGVGNDLAPDLWILSLFFTHREMKAICSQQLLEARGLHSQHHALALQNGRDFA